MPRRFAALAWLTASVFAVFALLIGCDLPTTRVPVTTRVIIVETTQDLAIATETMRAQGCALTHLIADPAGPGTWSVFACVDLGRNIPPVAGL